MTNWKEHLQKENDTYSNRESLDEIDMLIEIRKSLEARLRQDRIIIHGTRKVHGKSEDGNMYTGIAILTHIYEDARMKEQVWLYSTIFNVESSDVGAIVINYDAQINNPLERYCLELVEKFGLKINFIGQSQSS